MMVVSTLWSHLFNIQEREAIYKSISFLLKWLKMLKILNSKHSIQAIEQL